MLLWNWEGARSTINGFGIFVNGIQIDDDWRAKQRRYFSEESMRQVTDPDLACGDQPLIFLVELTTNINTEALTNLHH